MATTLKRINERRKEWLDLTKSIVEKAALRNTKLDDLCPSMHNCSEERQQTLKEVALLNENIGQISERMARLETEDEAFLGTAGLLGESEVTEDLRVCISLLIVKALSDSVSFLTHSVGVICDVCCARDPERAVELRCAFRIGGVIRPHIYCQPALSVEDFGDIRLKEQAFADMLFIKPDQGCALMAATDIMGC